MLHNSKQNINLAPLNFGPTTGEYYSIIPEGQQIK